MAGKESNTISVANHQPLIPMLKYHMWSLRMQTLFKCQGLWDLVEKGFADNQPAKLDKKLQKNRIMDAKAMFLIQQALDDEIFPLISSATTSIQAWHILKQQYLADNKVIGDKEKEMKQETSIAIPAGCHGGGRGEGEAPTEVGKKDKEEDFENAMVVVLTLIITLTYQALLNPPSSILKQATEINWACLPSPTDIMNCPAKFAFAFLFFNTAIITQSIFLLLWTLRGRRRSLLGGLTTYLTFCYFILLIPFSHYYIAHIVIPLFVFSVVFSATLRPSFWTIIKDMKRKERNPSKG